MVALATTAGSRPASPRACSTGLRAEGRSRGNASRHQRLPRRFLHTAPEAYHLWLRSARSLAPRRASSGTCSRTLPPVVPSDAFAVSDAPPEAVRLPRCRTRPGKLRPGPHHRRSCPCEPIGRPMARWFDPLSVLLEPQHRLQLVVRRRDPSKVRSGLQVEHDIDPIHEGLHSNGTLPVYETLLITSSLLIAKCVQRHTSSLQNGLA